MTNTKRHISRRTLLGGAAALTVTAGGGAAWAVDRYLIPHVEVADTTALEAQAGTSATTSSAATASSAATTASAPVITANSYTRDGLKITIEKVTTGSGSNTITYYVADVTITDALTCRSAFANNQFGSNIIAYTSAIASANNAVFAINGDYYGFRDTGIVIRNGVAYRDKAARKGLALYRNGALKLYDETSTSANQLLSDGVWQTWSFGPGIVDGGAIVSGIESVEVDTNFGNHSIQGQQPRTGIGAIGDNHLIFVVADGRSSGYSRGVTMTEFAQIFVDRHAQVAYNLDGGGSSVMWFNGNLVSNPLGKNQERGTSDIIYLA